MEDTFRACCLCWIRSKQPRALTFTNSMMMLATAEDVAFWGLQHFTGPRWAKLNPSSPTRTFFVVSVKHVILLEHCSSIISSQSVRILILTRFWFVTTFKGELSAHWLKDWEFIRQHHPATTAPVIPYHSWPHPLAPDYCCGICGEICCEFLCEFHCEIIVKFVFEIVVKFTLFHPDHMINTSL